MNCTVKPKVYYCILNTIQIIYVNKNLQKVQTDINCSNRHNKTIILLTQIHIYEQNMLPYFFIYK